MLNTAPRTAAFEVRILLDFTPSEQTRRGRDSPGFLHLVQNRRPTEQARRRRMRNFEDCGQPLSGRLRWEPEKPEYESRCREHPRFGHWNFWF
jgi:hypothetical protein